MRMTPKGRKRAKEEQVGFLVQLVNILKFDKYPFLEWSKALKFSNSIFSIFFSKAYKSW